MYINQMHADTFWGREASLAKSVLDPTSLDKARDPKETKPEELVPSFKLVQLSSWRLASQIYHVSQDVVA